MNRPSGDNLANPSKNSSRRNSISLRAARSPVNGTTRIVPPELHTRIFPSGEMSLTATYAPGV